MKKTFIYLLLCCLFYYSYSQSSAYIVEANIAGNTKFVRQWENNPGFHVVYYTDVMTGMKGYIGVTDVYNVFRHVQVSQNCIITDMEVFNNTVYFCGHTATTNKGLIGWMDLNSIAIGSSASAFIDSTTLISSLVATLDNIEVYQYVVGIIHVIGYGKTNTSKYVGIQYDISLTPLYYTLQVWEDFPYTPQDLTITDNYIVFAGTRTGIDIVIHPFHKNGALTLAYAPYCTYPVSTPTAIEPITDVHVVDRGDDRVATLTYKYEGSVYSMMLREYDVSNALINPDIPMISSYRVAFHYAIGNIYDFRYNVFNKVYTIFQNYEVQVSDYHDVVTKVDFHSGVPSSVQSDYLLQTNQVMKSMSLADSSMYVVYGHDLTSNNNLFWKDLQTIPEMWTCLKNDILPLYVASPVSKVRYDLEGNVNFYNPGFAPSLYNVSRKRITVICH